MPPGTRVYEQIGLDLQIAVSCSGFERYRSLGMVHQRITGEITNGAFVDEIPDIIRALATDITNEMRRMAFLVSQNEYGTVGTPVTPQQYVFSTGFYLCLGIVLYRQDIQRAALVHKAPATAVEATLEALLNDFGEDSSTATAFIFGGGDTEVDNTRRDEVVAGLGPRVGDVIVVTRAELGVDNGYGLFFDRTSGAYGIIRGAPHDYYVRDHPEMTIMPYARRAANTTNDNKGARAQLLSALR